MPTCVDAARFALAFVALTALAAAAVHGGELKRSGSAGAAAGLAKTARVGNPPQSAARVATGKSQGKSTAGKAQRKVRSLVQQTAYEESDAAGEAETREVAPPAPSLDGPAARPVPVYDTTVIDLAAPKSDVVAQSRPYEPRPLADDDLAARRERFRKQISRPFKQMREINPFYDYEPDAEVLEKDRCYNLCPRPGSPDCPECAEIGPDGPVEGRLNCPECPEEIDLRDTARVVASINDFPVRSFPHLDYCWEPTNLSAYPLYFEDFSLERYGHTRHYLLQPPFSVGLFAAQFVLLPYQMAIDPPWCKRYALGYYRPGQYVPPRYYQVPWNTHAFLTEAAVVTGAAFLFAPSLSP